MIGVDYDADMCEVEELFGGLPELLEAQRGFVEFVHLLRHSHQFLKELLGDNSEQVLR